VTSRFSRLSKLARKNQLKSGKLRKKSNSFTLVLLMSDMRKDSFWLDRLSLINSPTLARVIQFNIYQDNHFNFVKKNTECTFYYRSLKHLVLICFLCIFLVPWKGKKIVHAHGQIAGIIGSALKVSRGIPLLLDRHHGHQNYVKSNSKGVLFDILTSRLASQILVHSEQALESLHVLEPWTTKKSRCVMLPIDIQKFTRKLDSPSFHFRKSFNISSKTFLVGTNARGESWKGLLTVIKGFRKFHERVPDSTLFMLNISPLDEEYSRIMDEIVGLPVILEKNYTPIEDFFHSLDLFCHTPVSKDAEAAGLVYLEALISQTPSIFTKSGIVAKFVESPRNTLFIDYLSDDQCYEGMLNFYLKRGKVGTNTLDIDFLQFNSERYLAQMLSCYKNILD
jgi:glycosyltransferase involved in cell wall biosynthesis